MSGRVHLQSRHHLRLNRPKKERLLCCALGVSGDVGGVSSCAANDSALKRGPWELEGATLEAVGGSGLARLVMTAGGMMTGVCLLRVDAWLMVRRCLLSMEARRRVTDSVAVRGSSEMKALGDKSASGWGSLVLETAPAC